MHHYMYLCQPEFRILVHPPLHSYMETWVPRCGTVCMFQSVHCWSHTLFRKCTCRRRCGTRWGVTETLTWGHPGANILAATMWRVGVDLGCQVDMPACADACTHYNQGAENRWAMTGICRWGNTGMDRFEHNYVKGLGRIALVSLSNK